MGMTLSDKVKGIIAVVISGMVYGCMPLMAKTIYREGGNSISLSFYRFFLLLPFLYILIKRNKNLSLKVTREEVKHLAIIAIMGYGATPVLLYSSYNYISSGLATTVHFIYPVFVILICILFYKDKASPIKLISLLLCLIGIIMFHDGNGETNFLGLALSFGSGMTYAFYTVHLDKSIIREMHTLKATFYFILIAAIILLVFGLTTRSISINLTPLGWLATLIMTLIVGFGGTYLFQIGVKTIGSQNTSILSTLEPITSVIVGAVILNESFGIKTFLGVALIITAVILISIFEA